MRPRLGLPGLVGRKTRRSCSVYRVQAIQTRQIGQRVDKFQRSTKEHVSAYVLSPVICDECVVRSNLQGGLCGA